MPELFGRSDELRQLTELWTAAQSGDGSVAIVSAEAGGGKSALIDAFTGPLQAAGAVLRGNCFDGEGGRPFSPWLSILPEQAVAALLRESESEAGRFAAFREAKEAFGSIAGPRIVVIDDFHWADGASLRLLEFLAPDIAESPRLLILATRPTPRREVQATIGALIRRGAIRLNLRPLSAGELAQLMPPGAEIERIARLTGGNPLLANEYARHLAAGGDPEQTPESLPALIQDELRRLTPAAQQLANVAALIDGNIAREIVLGAAKADDGALDELVAAGLLLPRDERFQWRHDALREAVLAGIPTSLRLELEGALAQAFLSYGDEDGAAYHGCRAGERWDPQRAHLAAHNASRRWASQYSVELAAGYADLARSIRRLIELSPAERLAIDMFEGELLTQVRRGAEAREILREAATLARSLGDWEALARIALSFGLGHEHGTAHDPEVIALLQEALALAPPGAHRIRSQLLSRSAWQALDTGAVERRAALAREAVSEARMAEETPALANALLALCWGLARPEDLPERRVAASEALSAARESGDLELQLGALFRQFLVSLELGDLSTARRAAAAYDEITTRCPLPYHRWYAPLFNGTLALMAGDLDGAQARASEIDPASTTQEQQAHVMLSALQSEILIVRGGSDRIRGARLVHDVCERALGMGWLFRPRLVALEAGVPAALPVLTAAIERGLSTPADEDYLGLLAVLAETAVLMGAKECCERMFEAMQPFADRWVVIANGANCRGPVASFLAATARVAGNAVEAAAFREQAEQLILAENAPGVRVWLDLQPLEKTAASNVDNGPLTPREAEVLALLARGHSNQEIADTLVISVRTVQRHVENVYNRLDIHNRAEAAIRAVSLGLIGPNDQRPQRG